MGETVYNEKYGFWDFTKYRESDLSGEGYLPDENDRYFHLARKARDNGWRHLIPISPSTKACYVPGWDKWGRVEATDDEIRSWILGDPRDGLGPDIGFGFAHNGSLVVIDLDYEDGNDVRRRLRYLAENVPGTPMIRVGKGPGCQIYYRAHPTAYGRQCGPEIFHKNKQTVLFGRHPITGRPFKWKGGSPATRKFHFIPEIHGPHLDLFLEQFGHDRIPGRQGGLVMSILKDRPKGSLDLMSLKEMADRLAQTTKGMRHPTAQEPSERRNAEREFADLIRYAESRTPRAIGGVHVKLAPYPEFEP